MLRVVCAKSHYTAKRDPSHWRYDRACEYCGEPTQVDYGVTCSHQGWRYPCPLPVDGDMCASCNHEHVEPLRGIPTERLNRLRGLGELLAVMIEEANGFYPRREATQALYKIARVHHFSLTRPDTKGTPDV